MGLGRYLRWTRRMWAVLALLLALAILPLLMVQGFLYYRWFTAQRALEERNNLELARAVARSFEEFIRDVRQEEAALAAALISLGPYTTEHINLMLSLSVERFPGVRSWHWIDPDGIIVASSDAKARGLDVSDRDYFKATRAGREWALSDLTIGRATGLPTFFISTRVDGADGVLKGTLAASVDPWRLGELGMAVERGREGRIRLFDSRDALAYERPRGPISSGGRIVIIHDSLLRKVRAGQEAKGIIDSDVAGGGRLIAARVPVRGTGWVAGAARPESEAMSPILRTLNLVLTVSVATLLASLGAALLISRRIALTVRRLGNHAVAVGNGDLRRRVSGSGVIELRDLASALNAMTQELQDRTEAMEKTAQELERSNRDLAQYAAIAAHDLQEPLRVVAGFLQILERKYKGKLDPEADRYIAFAVDGAVRMKALINDLLAYSRVETRGKPFAMTDCASPLSEAIKNLSETITATGARVTCTAMPVLSVDSAQLTQLFQNLIGNAIKFHGASPPEVEVSARDTGEAWEFTVRDNGIGIETQYFDKIFVIFQRLHSRDEYPGTGVGLAICKKVVERHGGRIWVESEMSKGSAFYFTIPKQGLGVSVGKANAGPGESRSQ
jgi:signal transduction histidine kinase